MAAIAARGLTQLHLPVLVLPPTHQSCQPRCHSPSMRSRHKLALRRPIHTVLHHLSTSSSLQLPLFFPAPPPTALHGPLAILSLSFPNPLHHAVLFLTRPPRHHSD